MMLYPPRSTLQLILYGFGAVALPLILSLGYAAISVDRMAEQSKHTLYQGVLAVQSTQTLGQLLITMERIARQHLILKDTALMEAYQRNHEKFQATAGQLFKLPLNPSDQAHISQLITAENALFIDISTETNVANITSRFSALTDLSDTVQYNSNQLIDHELKLLKQTAGEAQNTLFRAAVGLVPLTLAFVGIFSFLISKPIRQLELAIRQLGSGKLNADIAISGPRDLRDLGHRLNWLSHRLSELEQQKTRFLQHISHELKTPLTAIREVGELLGENLAGPLNAQQSEIVRILRSNTIKLQSLIENLLNFSLKNDDVQTNKQPGVSLKKIINAAIDSHKPALLSKSINVHTDLHPIKLDADPERLFTVMDNLLSNAVKFSPRQTNITIKLFKQNQHAVISVADQGCGIAPEDSLRVFEPFQQISKPADSAVEGSGLGLSITKEYVNAHAGTIRVIDTGSEGAHIQVQLPLQADNTVAQ